MKWKSGGKNEKKIDNRAQYHTMILVVTEIRLHGGLALRKINSILIIPYSRCMLLNTIPSTDLKIKLKLRENTFLKTKN